MPLLEMVLTATLETIPTPTTLQAAFHHRNKREKDLLNDDPAMQFPNGRGQLPIPPSPTPVTYARSSLSNCMLILHSVPTVMIL